MKYKELVIQKLRQAGFKKYIVSAYIDGIKEHSRIYVDDDLTISEMELIIKTLNEVRDVYISDELNG